MCFIVSVSWTVFNVQIISPTCEQYMFFFFFQTLIWRSILHLILYMWLFITDFLETDHIVTIEYSNMKSKSKQSKDFLTIYCFACFVVRKQNNLKILRPKNKCLVSGNVPIFFRVGRKVNFFFLEQSIKIIKNTLRIEENFSYVPNKFAVGPKKVGFLETRHFFLA